MFSSPSLFFHSFFSWSATEQKSRLCMENPRLEGDDDYVLNIRATTRSFSLHAQSVSQSLTYLLDDLSASQPDLPLLISHSTRLVSDLARADSSRLKQADPSKIGEVKTRTLDKLHFDLVCIWLGFEFVELVLSLESERKSHLLSDLCRILVLWTYK